MSPDKIQSFGLHHAISVIYKLLKKFPRSQHCPCFIFSGMNTKTKKLLYSKRILFLHFELRVFLYVVHHLYTYLHHTKMKEGIVNQNNLHVVNLFFVIHHFAFVYYIFVWWSVNITNNKSKHFEKRQEVIYILPFVVP